MLHAADSGVEEPDWAVGLNLLGLFTNIGTQALRIARSGDADGEPTESSDEARAYVRPGPNGTEIGVVLRP